MRQTISTTTRRDPQTLHRETLCAGRFLITLVRSAVLDELHDFWFVADTHQRDELDLPFVLAQNYNRALALRHASSRVGFDIERA